jgi:predicted acylesterase/phospholipase RssA
MVRPFDPVSPSSLNDLKIYFPDARPDPAPRCFEIAIAAAGGTSTGAYIAGVFDFLVEALDAYSKAQSGPDAATAPTHKVKVVNLTGTSAGGLSAALACNYALKQFPHVYHDKKWADLTAAGMADGLQDTNHSPLYRAWVEEVDLSRLLAPTPKELDISIFSNAPSIISDIVFNMMEEWPKPRPWPTWATERLDLRLAIGNLRGIPYSLSFENYANPLIGERFTLHQDHVAFAVSSEAADGAPDAHALGLAGYNRTPEWILFKSTAVASSAIPVVFAPVSVLNQDPVAYQWRDGYFDTATGQPVMNLPFWQHQPSQYSFTSTDGGVFDNAPFDIAHRRLAGVNGVNKREGDQANRAVILIAPIIEEGEGDPTDPILRPSDETKPTGRAVLTPVSRLFSALERIIFSPIDQCRLAAFDLALIKSENVFSRYMICPSREHPAHPEIKMGPSHSLMSIPLQAAMGFAAKAYRRHDYLLGRRNAQAFLMNDFKLPPINSIIDPNDPWEPEDQIIDKDPTTGASVIYYPIIPLRGAAHRKFEEYLPDWPWRALTTAAISGFGAQLGVRLSTIWAKVKASYPSTAAPDANGDPPGGLARLGKGFLKFLITGPIAAMVWLFLRPFLVNAFKSWMTEERNKLNPANIPLKVDS